MDHPAELLIVMTDDPKGAKRGDESHSTKKPMEGVLGNEWHIHPGGLAWTQVEGITHVHLHHSKVIIPPVFLHACSKAMNNLLSSRRAGNSKLKNSVALCLVRVHKLHFPVSLLRTSPTAMGLISWHYLLLACSKQSDCHLLGIWRPGEVPYLMHEGSLCP